MTIRPY